MEVDQETEFGQEDENLERSSNWNEVGSASEESFTLNLKVCEEDVYEEDSNSSDLIIASNDEVSEKCDERRGKRSRLSSFKADIPVAFEDMEDEIERQLDAKAAKSNLSVVNVKNILKSVITNEDVMAMVRHSLQNDGDGNWLTYEPKLTRSKAKELMKAQTEMSLPIYTPTKKQSECQLLIEKELSEDSSDDEYKPVDDELEQSEDEKSSVADSLSSPVRKVTTPTILLSPETRNLDSRDEDAVTNVECGTQTCWTDDGLFKVPQPRLEPTERVEENIGQRTRSKLSLNNTPLEVIESAFIPPDITTDMYESDCDDEDWKSFLKDFALNSENIDDDDAADPEYNVLADFDQQTVDKEELRVDKAVKISRKEKKVLMAEAHEPLFSDDDDFDLLQFFPNMENSESQLPQNVPLEQSEHTIETGDHRWIYTTPTKNAPCNVSVPVADNEKENSSRDSVEAEYADPLSPPPSPNDCAPPEINDTQMAIFKQQMRQHVQILTQNFMQTYCHPGLAKHAESCKSLLVSLKCLSLYKENSNFEAENLNAAIELVERWEKWLLCNPEEKNEIIKFYQKEIDTGKKMRKAKSKYQEKLPKQVIDFMAASKVFIYPLLLPEMGFRCDRVQLRTYLYPEDQLIALGLEQFTPYCSSKGNPTKKKILNDVVSLLHQFILPYRTNVNTRQFIVHAKYLPNDRATAVHHYLTNGKAPETKHFVFPVDWDRVKCPKEVPKGRLPEMWARQIHGFDKEEEKYLKYRPKRNKRNKVKWCKRYAVPVLLIGDFPDRQTAESFGEGTLDYTLLSGRIFKMLPSMPLISNISKDIVENTSSNPDLPNVIFTVGGMDRGTQTRIPGVSLSLPQLTSPNKKASPLKRVTPILKKYNSHRKGKSGNVPKSPAPFGDKNGESVPSKQSPRQIAPKPMVVFLPTDDLNFPEIVAATPEDSSNTHRTGDSNATQETPASTARVGSTEPVDANSDNAQQGLPADKTQQDGLTEESSAIEKKDNEDELAALMIASTTIRGPTTSIERKRKSKQQRDTDANLALLSPEKGSATEERDYVFAHAFFKKLEMRLKNGTEEGSSSFDTLVHTLNELSEEKPSHEVENLLKRILRVLAPHRDLLEEFSCFLNSKQALHYGCLSSHLLGIQMRDFVHKLEVYFAKQPNHVHKIVDAISSLTNRPNISLEEIKEEVVPLLKGNLILLNKLHELLPTVRPPDSLMTDFEDLEFGEDDNLMGEEEPVENVKLPEKDLSDKYGGEGCPCSCHPISSESPPSEKETSRSSHCNRCGLKFVNGRVVLQTAKGIRPAKVTFESPAEFKRVVAKDTVPPPRINKSRSRKKSKPSDNKDDTSSPPPKIRAVQVAESDEDMGAFKLSEFTTPPKGQSRSGGKGSRGSASRGKDAKNASQKLACIETSHSLDTPTSQNVSSSSDVSSVSEGNCSIVTNANNKCSSDELAKCLKDSSASLTEKNMDKIASQCSQNLENQRSSEESPCSITDSCPKDDQSNSGNEHGGSTTNEVPWTREEDRIILQTFQADGGKSDTFVKIREKLPERSVTEIASRFHKLMSLFRKMTGPTTGNSSCEAEDIDIERSVSENS